jgi:DNA-binding NtrC family response regulator
VARGRLRRDLYARLAAAILRIPPLRERREDLGLLAERLWARVGGRPDDCRSIFTPHVIDVMSRRPWPGNVRDLAHAISQAVLFVRMGDPGTAIEQLLQEAGREWHLEEERVDRIDPDESTDSLASVGDWDSSPGSPSAHDSLQRHTEQSASTPATKMTPEQRRDPAMLKQALEAADGRISRAAKILGMSRSHAYRLYKQLEQEGA